MKKALLCIGLVFALCLSGVVPCVLGQGAKGVKAEDAVRVQVAKLRGKLLYKKSQIRKLEKAACNVSPELKIKMEAMEKEKRTQYIAADPKLEGLYAEQDAIEEEIQKLAGKNAAMEY